MNAIYINKICEVINVAARLTDRQRKKIIADYVELGSYRATAKRNEVSTDTVKRIVLTDGEIVQKATQKKEQNTVEMLAYMDSEKNRRKKSLTLIWKHSKTRRR